MAEIQPQERWWDDPATGQKLLSRVWVSPKARGWLVLVHGFGEHGGRYLPLGSALAEQGIGVICTDLPGHGRSSGARGDCHSIQQHVEMLQAVARDLCGVTRSLAVFGHSLGGLIAVHWALRSPASLRCLILQGPLLEVGFRIPPWKIRLADGLARVWPAAPVPMGLNPAWLSHDEEVVRQYRRDPLIVRAMTARASVVIRMAMAQAREQAPAVTVPTLMMWGTADQVVSVPACEQWYATLICERRLKTFSGSFHELHHEAVREDARNELVQWVEAHA